METISLPACEVAIDNNGIIICTPADSHNITGEDAIRIIEAQCQLTNQQISPVLVDHTVPHSLTYEAMQIFSEGRYTSAVAFLFSTALNRKTIEYFVETGKPRYPVELFSEREVAINWLLEYA